MTARRSARFLAKDLAYALCWLGAGFDARGIRVCIFYHSIGGDDPLAVSTAEFARQMSYLRRHFRVMALRDLRAATETDDRPAACVTFDDGLLDNYENAMPVLGELGLPATFFVPSGSIGEAHRSSDGRRPRCMDAAQLRELAARGHEIGSHTVSHPDMRKLAAPELDRELGESKRALEDLVGGAVTSFAYPKGKWSPASRAAVERAGYACAATTRESLIPREEIDWLLVPRVAVNGTMRAIQYRAKLSRALTVYERLRRSDSQPLYAAS